jgi:hypothetical protein
MQFRRASYILFTEQCVISILMAMAGQFCFVELFYKIDGYHNLSTTVYPDCDFLVCTQSTSSACVSFVI